MKETSESVSQHLNNTDGNQMHAFHKLKNYLSSRKELVVIISLVVIVVLMPLSILLLMQGIHFIGKAQSTNNAEPETGTLAGNVVVGSDTNASNGQFVHFGIGGTPVTFQPSAPYHGTFYYMWYKNQTTDGSWNGSYWNDLGNNPPTTWFSHYIPDQDGSSATFTPASQLYSSNDYANFKWQATKLAEAKQEVAIGSWWGQGGKEDSAFNTILNTFMGKTDNPYPNLRWALYYECEGNVSAACGGTSNPTVTQIVSDLQYIQSHYASSPYFLKVSGKPVIFVYADGADGGTTDTTCSDSSMVSRWKQANTQLGNTLYIVLKVFSGYQTSACQPDSWHQYAPATRSGSHSTYDYFVSPGFWKDDGSAVVLARDATAFENAVKSMVAYNAIWKLTQTWNEWGEGSSVEPGFQAIVSGGTETIDPAGTSFGNLYVDILNRNLPALEQGTGSNPQPTPTSLPTPTIPPSAGDPVIVAAGDMACGVGSIGAACKQMETSDLFVGTSAVVNPDAVLPLGDNQYESGELSDWNSFFDPSWGRAIAKTYPVIGNHEYLDPAGGAKGTFDYFEAKFGGPGNTTTRPGARGQGYYSFDLGSWHLVALNSNCSQAGGCDVGSPQETWLKQDLTAHTNNKCVLAFWHHPWWSSGGRAREGAVLPLLQALYDNNADLILTGHDHTYERFAPQDTNDNPDALRGMREFVIGTGGRNHTSLAALAPNSEKFDSTTFGVLKLTLHPTSYDWQFIPANFSGNGTFTDSGAGQGCH